MKKVFSESFHDLCWVLKTILTTFWFWVPIIYGLYFIVQLWMMFFIHPLSVIVVASVFAIYAIRLEGKRSSSRYGHLGRRRLSASHGFGEGPQQERGFRWRVEQTVEQYEHLLKGENTLNRANKVKQSSSENQTLNEDKEKRNTTNHGETKR